jgi:hypothetical protein
VDRGASHYVTAAPTPAQRHTLALSSRRAIFEFGIAIRLCARDNTAFFRRRRILCFVVGGARAAIVALSVYYIDLG